LDEVKSENGTLKVQSWTYEKVHALRISKKSTAWAIAEVLSKSNLTGDTYMCEEIADV
jgi:hypothetical protein